MRRLLICLFSSFSLFTAVDLRAEQAGSTAPANGSLIVPNDNRIAAGVTVNGVLTLKLVAQLGGWQPEGPQGRTLTVQAFREEGRPLTIPAPLVRVPDGTQIHVSIRNDMAGTTLTVFGMRERPATSADAGLEVPAGETRGVRFGAGQPGTYRYWATTPLALNGRSLPVPAPAPGPYTMSLRQNVPNRLRLINITPDNVALTFVLTDGFRTVNWKPVAKDGADLP